jgi:hypothetical protein
MHSCLVMKITPLAMPLIIEKLQDLVLAHEPPGF